MMIKGYRVDELRKLGPITIEITAKDGSGNEVCWQQVISMRQPRIGQEIMISWDD